jgi:ATP/maltotriose-dependent transcriptional regulator MalT
MVARAGTPKTTRPALGKVFRRERLFRRLHALARRCPVVWVSAAAGSGKTTLAASWLASLGAPCVWYQLDGRDADPAAFFFYVREAVGRLWPRHPENVPLLGPEYARGTEAFAAFFFEVLAGRLPRGAWLVLDDYQDCPEDAPLHRLLAVGAARLSGDAHLLVLSRSLPPPAFARLAASGKLASLAGDELGLDATEIRALARASTGRKVGPREADDLAARTGGWAAGVVLFLEARREAGSIEGPGDPTPQVLFDYFATEILERAPPAARRLLLATAFLPEIDVPAAEALAGEPRAGELLADLVRRNYFTLRLGDRPPRYRYHPLFREFLQATARRTLDPAEHRERVAGTARALLAAGRADDAAILLAGEGHRESLAELVRAHAEAFARHGRLASLEGWLRSLPEPMVRGDPWLSYWLGTCRLEARDEARDHLQRAYRAFKALDDVPGMLLAWAGLVGTYFFSFDEFASLDPWIAEMEELQARRPGFASPDVEAQVAFGMLGALMWRHGAHPLLADWRRRAEALAGDAAVSPVLRMQLASQLAIYNTTWRGDYAATGEVIERVRGLSTAPDVTPLTRMLFFQVEAHYRARLGDHVACLRAVEEGLAVARATGVTGLTHAIALQGVYGGLASGDLGTARRYLALAREAPGQGIVNRGHVHLLAAWTELCAGDLRAAGAELARDLKGGDRTGTEIARVWLDAAFAQCQIERGEADAAVDTLARCMDWSRRVGERAVLHHALLSTAYAHVVRGRIDEALPPLRDGLRLGREQGYLRHPWIGWRREVMSRLAALALEHGIEVQHVLAVIAASGLLPPADRAPEAWPWPLRVRMLGGFEVWRGDQRLALEGKAQRRPLVLLRTLVAMGAGVRQEALVDALWPDAEGDAGDHALEMALHRLRALLGIPGLVVQQGRRISLDARRCWVDALALERRLDRATECLRGKGEGRALEGELRAIAALYRGPLTPTADDGLDRALPMRERLRARLRGLARAAGERLAAEARPGAAQWFVERVGSADPGMFGPDAVSQA